MPDGQSELIEAMCDDMVSVLAGVHKQYGPMPKDFLDALYQAVAVLESRLDEPNQSPRPDLRESDGV